MSEIKTPNLPVMSVDNIIRKLSESYISVINHRMSVSILPSVMLWGPPGVGKSQAIRQIKDEIEYATKKKVNVTDVRLLLFNPIDLRGIPTANHDKTLAVWLKPQIFQMDDSDDVINILFLDEISAAPQSVQAAAYQITLDRVVGEHKLPDNCIVIAAGNRTTDKSVAYKMPKALANRLLHIEVEGNFESWKKWAVSKGINDKVISFLSFRTDLLMEQDSKYDDLAFTTPRSWEKVSDLLNYVNDDVNKMYDLISGLIGTGVATEFRTWCKIYHNLPNVKDIFKGVEVSVPKLPDELYALSSSIVAHARLYKDDLKKIENSLRYIELLPPDYAVIIIKDYLYIEKDYKLKLMKLPSFVKWMNTKGRLLNAID